MPRPFCCRRIAGAPVASVFKPAGIPARELDEVAMTLDEFEALRLADLDGLYQEQVAAHMGVSRATVGRIVESARRKVADALTHGKVLRIAGGPIVEERLGSWQCPRCAGAWDGPPGCPRCGELPRASEPATPRAPWKNPRRIGTGGRST